MPKCDREKHVNPNCEALPLIKPNILTRSITIITAKFLLLFWKNNFFVHL